MPTFQASRSSKRGVILSEAVLTLLSQRYPELLLGKNPVSGELQVYTGGHALLTRLLAGPVCPHCGAPAIEGADPATSPEVRLS